MTTLLQLLPPCRISQFSGSYSSDEFLSVQTSIISIPKANTSDFWIILSSQLVLPQLRASRYSGERKLKRLPHRASSQPVCWMLWGCASLKDFECLSQQMFQLWMSPYRIWRDSRKARPSIRTFMSFRIQFQGNRPLVPMRGVTRLPNGMSGFSQKMLGQYEYTVERRNGVYFIRWMLGCQNSKAQGRAGRSLRIGGEWSWPINFITIICVSGRFRNRIMGKIRGFGRLNGKVIVKVTGYWLDAITESLYNISQDLWNTIFYPCCLVAICLPLTVVSPNNLNQYVQKQNPYKRILPAELHFPAAARLQLSEQLEGPRPPLNRPQIPLVVPCSGFRHGTSRTRVPQYNSSQIAPRNARAQGESDG